MELTKQQIQEFSCIYKKNSGIDLPEDEALKLALCLLSVGENILLPNMKIGLK